MNLTQWSRCETIKGMQTIQQNYKIPNKPILTILKTGIDSDIHSWTKKPAKKHFYSKLEHRIILGAAKGEVLHMAGLHGQMLDGWEAGEAGLTACAYMPAVRSGCGDHGAPAHWVFFLQDGVVWGPLVDPIHLRSSHGGGWLRGVVVAGCADRPPPTAQRNFVGYHAYGVVDLETPKCGGLRQCAAFGDIPIQRH